MWIAVGINFLAAIYVYNHVEMTEKTQIRYTITSNKSIKKTNVTDEEYWSDGTPITSKWMTIEQKVSSGNLSATENDSQLHRYSEMKPIVLYGSSGSCEFNPITIKQKKSQETYILKEVWIGSGVTQPEHTKIQVVPEEGGTYYIYAYGIEVDYPNQHITNIELFSASTVLNESNMDLTLSDIPKSSTEYVRWKVVIGNNTETDDKSATIMVYFKGYHEEITIIQNKHVKITGDTIFQVDRTEIPKEGDIVIITAYTTVDGEIKLLNLPKIVYSDSEISSGITIIETGSTTYTALFDEITMASMGGIALKRCYFQTTNLKGETINTKEIVKQYSPVLSYKFDISCDIDNDGNYYVPWSGGDASITAYTEVDGTKYPMSKPEPHIKTNTTKTGEEPAIVKVNDEGLFKAVFNTLSEKVDATPYGDYGMSVNFTSEIGYNVYHYGELGYATSKDVFQETPLSSREFVFLFHENQSSELIKNNYSSSGETGITIDIDSWIKISDTDKQYADYSATTEYSWIHLKSEYYQNSSPLIFDIDARTDDEGDDAYNDRSGVINLTQIIPSGFYSEDPAKEITLTIYQNDKNRKILPNFDKLILNYKLGDSNGKDLDTIAYTPSIYNKETYTSTITNSLDGTNIIQGSTIGWNVGDGVDGTDVKYINQWAGDNQSSNGYESDYFDVRQILCDSNLKLLETADRKAGISYENRKFVIKFYGVWYVTVSNTTPIYLTMEGYSGGTVDSENYRFFVEDPIETIPIGSETVHVLQKLNGQGYKCVQKWSPSNHWYTHFGDLEYYYEGSGKWIWNTDDEQTYYNEHGKAKCYYSGDTEVSSNSLKLTKSLLTSNVITIERTVYNYLYSEDGLITADGLPDYIMSNSLYYNGNTEYTISCEMSDDNSYIRTLSFEDPNNSNSDASQYVSFVETPQLIGRNNIGSVTYIAKTIMQCSSEPVNSIPNTWSNINGFQYKYKSVLPNIAIAWEVVE